MRFLLTILLLANSIIALALEFPASVERWDAFELTLAGPAEGNPYVDVSLAATFTRSGVQKTVAGFYDGAGVYRVRFMPDAEGKWTFRTASSSAVLDRKTGAFLCTPARPGNHGPVRVRDTYHFAYEDGTPFHHFGTTAYNWINQPAVLQEQTLETLGQNSFNKLRFLVFPKYYDFNHVEPPIWPFMGGPHQWKFDKPRYAFFRNLDTRVRQLRDLGIEADIIVTHPYDDWGLTDMSGEPEDRYFRYLVARLSAYRNVWWSMCNEYEFRPRPEAYWDRMFKLFRDSDPYQHLRSIHNAFKVYDHGKPWVTHASLQEQTREHTPVNFRMSMTRGLRERYGKPVVWDEVRYEGNFPDEYFWGRLSPEEMTRRFWIGLIHGAYVGHSETYMHEQDIIWWSRGGVLYGGSPARIAFQRQIVEQLVPGQKLDPVAGDMTAAHKGTSCYLYYYSTRVAASRTYDLPAGAWYRAYVIDTWNMTRTDAGLHAGPTVLTLPELPYMAVLFVREGV